MLTCGSAAGQLQGLWLPCIWLGLLRLTHTDASVDRRMHTSTCISIGKRRLPVDAFMICLLAALVLTSTVRDNP